MELPEKPRMKEVMHGHGANGFAFYSYEDTDELGIVHDVRRQGCNQAFVSTFRFKWLPDREFKTYAEMCAAVAPLTPDGVAAEQAKWPADLDVRERRSIGGRCWLHPDRPATHTGTLTVCWIKSCATMAVLCTDCAVAAVRKPLLVLDAREERRVAVAFRHNARALKLAVNSSETPQ